MLTVRFFAMLKSMVGKETIQLPCKGDMTVSELKDAILKEFPQMSEYLTGKRVLISVNQEFAAPETILKDGDEVAFLPPFSGG